MDLSKEDKRKILKSARDLVAERWTKGAFTRRVNGIACFCALGALRMEYAKYRKKRALSAKIVLNNHHPYFEEPEYKALMDDLDAAANKVSELIGIKLHGRFRVTGYNDCSFVKQKDVVQMFDEALKKYIPTKPRRKVPKTMRGADANE